MDNVLQDAGIEECKTDLQGELSQLADLQLAMVGGGIGNVLWG